MADGLMQGLGQALKGFSIGAAGKSQEYDQQQLKNKMLRQQTMFKDAAGALNLAAQKDWGSVAGLYQNRMEMAKNFPGVDFGQTAQRLELAQRAAAGDTQAQQNLLGGLSRDARIGQAMGVVPKPPKEESYTLSPGQKRFEGGKEIAYVPKAVDPDADLDRELKILKKKEVMANLDAKNLAVEEKKAKAVATAEAKDSAQVAQAFEAQTAIETVASLIDGGAYKSIYGAGDDFIPTILPGSVTAEAQRDQLIGLLSLESRQKLKGQGTISDSESKMLGQSATILARAGIEESDAKKELERVRRIFQRALNKAARNPAAANAIREAGMGQDDTLIGSGKVMRFDAQGNPI